MNGCSCRNVEVLKTENVSNWGGLEPPTFEFMPYVTVVFVRVPMNMQKVIPQNITHGLVSCFLVFMMTSSNGKICRVTGHLCGEFTSPGEFPAQRPVTRSFDVFFDLSLNKRLSKQPPGWWCETPLWSLWRQCNALKLINLMDSCYSFRHMIQGCSTGTGATE